MLPPKSSQNVGHSMGERVVLAGLLIKRWNWSLSFNEISKGLNKKRNMFPTLMFAGSECWELETLPPSGTSNSFHVTPSQGLPVGYLINRSSPLLPLPFASVNECRNMHVCVHILYATSGSFKIPHVSVMDVMHDTRFSHRILSRSA